MAPGLLIAEPPSPGPSDAPSFLDGVTFYYYWGASWFASLILILFSAHLLCKCIHKRLWLFPCYPTPFTALNAATLALLTIAVKVPKYDNLTLDQQQYENDKLNNLAPPFNELGSVVACALIGAYLPSIASTDRSQMWTNFAGAVLLLMTISFNILYYTIDPAFLQPYRIFGYLFSHVVCQAACLVLFILALIVQAISMDEMISDVAACVSMGLQSAETWQADVPGAYEKHVIVWSWEALEHTTCIKLMMALTSNLQNVASRSPSSAILLALLLIPLVMFAQVLSPLYVPFNLVISILPFGFICVGRWLRLAMYDDRPLPSLFLHSYPFHSRQKFTNFFLHLKAGPPRPLHPTIWQHISFTVKSILYWTLAFIMLFLIGPLVWLWLTVVSSTHALSTLSVRIIIKLSWVFYWLSSWTAAKALLVQTRSKLMPPAELDLTAGVIHIQGEDPGIVHKLFEGSARLLIQRCIKKAESKPMTALETILKLSNQACHFKSNVVHEILHQRGTPPEPATAQHFVYGDQYGWSLTVVSLLEVLSTVELQGVGTIERTMTAMDAYKQARRLIAVVDEMHAPTICTREAYLRASTSLWLHLLNKSRFHKKQHIMGAKETRGIQVSKPVDILDLHLESARMQFQKYTHHFPWRMEVVKAYTMYTVCHNLRGWWMDVEKVARNNASCMCLIEHIHYLIAEVLAGCLCSVPVVFETRMSNAVSNGNVAEIETGIFLAHQAKQLWKRLQWPLHYDSNVVSLAEVSIVGFPLKEYWLQHTQAINDASISRKAKDFVEGSHSQDLGAPIVINGEVKLQMYRRGGLITIQ